MPFVTAAALQEISGPVLPEREVEVLRALPSSVLQIQSCALFPACGLYSLSASLPSRNVGSSSHSPAARSQPSMRKESLAE